MLKLSRMLSHQNHELKFSKTNMSNADLGLVNHNIRFGSLDVEDGRIACPIQVCLKESFVIIGTDVQLWTTVNMYWRTWNVRLLDESTDTDPELESQSADQTNNTTLDKVVFIDVCFVN